MPSLCHYFCWCCCFCCCWCCCRCCRCPLQWQCSSCRILCVKICQQKFNYICRRCALHAAEPIAQNTHTHTPESRVEALLHSSSFLFTLSLSFFLSHTVSVSAWLLSLSSLLLSATYNCNNTNTSVFLWLQLIFLCPLCPSRLCVLCFFLLSFSFSFFCLSPSAPHSFFNCSTVAASTAANQNWAIDSGPAEARSQAKDKARDRHRDWEWDWDRHTDQGCGLGLGKHLGAPTAA